MYIKRILVAVTFIGLIIAAVFSYSIYGKFFSPNTIFLGDEEHIYITSDAGYEEVREDLKPLVADIKSLDAVAKQKGYTTNVKPGHYIIKKGSNNNEIINSIRSRNIPVTVSFNNQERLEDLAGRIAQQIEADSISLLGAFEDPEFLKRKGLNRETAMTVYLPNTYEFYWNTGAEEFRERMSEEHRKFWNAERLKKAKAQGLKPEEVYTLASIVQKETVKRDEMPRVAGVYLNRLQNGWKLDADPTVIFAVKKTEGDFNKIIKRVLFKDLETDSPYNTYKYGGLPPGPIFMPDLSAINAVLNPEDHEYYFFVADVSNPGYHMFAKTLAQHNANRKQYIQWINKQGISR